MKLPFGFPKRTPHEPDDIDDRPLPTDAEVQAYLDRGSKGIKPAQPVSTQESTMTAVNPIETQAPITTSAEAQTPTSIGSGEIKG